MPQACPGRRSPDRRRSVPHAARIYLFPPVIPSLASPHAAAQPLAAVELLSAFPLCFGGRDEDVSYVDFDMASQGTELLRKTTVGGAGVVRLESEMTPLRRV